MFPFENSSGNETGSEDLYPYPTDLVEHQRWLSESGEVLDKQKVLSGICLVYTINCLEFTEDLAFCKLSKNSSKQLKTLRHQPVKMEPQMLLERTIYLTNN